MKQLQFLACVIAIVASWTGRANALDCLAYMQADADHRAAMVAFDKAAKDTFADEYAAVDRRREALQAAEASCQEALAYTVRNHRGGLRECPRCSPCGKIEHIGNG